MGRISAVLLTAILLFGCGGGDKKSSMPDPLIGGLQQPTFSDASIVPTINAIIQRSDSIIVSDYVGKFRGGTFLAPASCGRTSCTIDLGSGYTSAVDLRDIRDAGIDTSLGYTAVGERNGVGIGRGQGRTTSFGLSVDATSYGAWLNHSAFTFDLETVRSGSIGGVDFSGLQIGVGFTIGNDTGSRPMENATWRGIMVGGTDINGPPQTIRGDAIVTFDVDSNYVDVSFTNNFNLVTGARFQDLRWSDMRADPQGLFDVETPTRKLVGRFYGPNQAEVGGVFTHPQAIGAFGARR